MTSMIFAAGALIWMCQPRSLTRLDSGSIISGVVAPAWARLKRMPRTPSACMRLSSSVGHLSSTTATMRARRSERGQRVEVAAVVDAVRRRLHEHVAGGPDALLERAVVFDEGVGRPQRGGRIDRVLGVVDVVMAVGSVGGAFSLGARCPPTT